MLGVDIIINLIGQYKSLQDSLEHYICLSECTSWNELKGVLLASHPLFSISELARALFG